MDKKDEQQIMHAGSKDVKVSDKPKETEKKPTEKTDKKKDLTKKKSSQ